MEKKPKWQAVRGVCIFAVILIHALGGFHYTEDILFVILRQAINFAVPVFVFMAGYFVNTEEMLSERFNYKVWIRIRGGRLLVPFIIWSLFYSAVSLLQSLRSEEKVNWPGLICRLLTGKSATPFYYIVVLFQLTVITPYLARAIKDEKRKLTAKLLWLVTPVYLVYIYIWNFETGNQPFLYETLFPAWFVFYYLGMQVRCGLKLKAGRGIIFTAFLFSCAEALLLRHFGMEQGFYISQITAGSFLYSAAGIAWLLQMEERKGNGLLVEGGNCSYGIFYIHMIVLMFVRKIVQNPAVESNWFLYWGTGFLLTCLVSFALVRGGQYIFRNHKNILRWIGFE